MMEEFPGEVVYWRMIRRGGGRVRGGRGQERAQGTLGYCLATSCLCTNDNEKLLTTLRRAQKSLYIVFFKVQTK